MLPELFCGDALIAGHSEPDQLCAITEIIGPPPLEMLLQTKKKVKLGIDTNGILEYTLKRSGKRRKPNSRSLNRIFPKQLDSLFRDFLSRCLTWDPNIRLAPAEALEHKWLSEE